MNYLLDTNIIVIYGRDSDLADEIEKEYGLFSGDHNLGISSVTLGEIDSLTKQFGYGLRRKARLNELLENMFIIDINIQSIIDRYGDIDAYSQGKLESVPLKGTARNMGKNDLWIASTASVYAMELITTDKDFNHLKDVFVDLRYIEIGRYKK